MATGGDRIRNNLRSFNSVHWQRHFSKLPHFNDRQYFYYPAHPQLVGKPADQRLFYFIDHNDVHLRYHPEKH